MIYPYVLNYMDTNRSQLIKKYSKFEDFEDDFKVTEDMLKELVALGEKEGIEKTDKDYLAVVNDLKLHIKALIARDLWDSSAFYKIINRNNDFIIKTLQVLEQPELYEKELKNK